ncbi:MAG TPA: acyl-ACP thioesterase domain-containing protein [Sedimentisphaerales bacterium]|nr:acyl-ACP thioesterase domain-containing protein [Sedimentisphaerales bacterium]
MSEPREDRFLIRMYDCRPDGQVKTSSLMQYMQEAAACHAEQLGLGIRELERRGCLWVLVNLRVEMSDTPGWGDEVIVATWPSGCTRLIASREFIGRSPEGLEFFRAASDWMILDRQSGRPKNLDRLDLNLPHGGPKAPAVPPTRLQPGDRCAHVCSLSVPFSAMDLNGHVNNTEYVRWALDAVHQHIGSLPEIRTVQLTYQAEVFAGDEIELLVCADPSGPLGVCIRKRRQDAVVNAFLLEIL